MYSRHASSSHGGGLAPPPQTTSASASAASRQKAPRPTGRVELLEWVNQVCRTHYPSIECLRDGIAYLTLVEATVAKTEPLLSSTSSASSTRASAPPSVSLPRTSAARALIEKIDHHVSLADASSSSHHNSAALDPALDTIQTKERCERNFHLLQAMLRECLMDKSHGMAVDVKRLASGKLQEHMRLLQWSVGFVEQQFLLAEKAAAKRQQQQTPTAGLSGGAARQSRAASRGDTTGVRARSSGGGPPPAAAATHHRDPTEEITSGQGVRRQRTASASATVQRTSQNSALSVTAKEQPTTSGASYDASSYITTAHTKTSVVEATTTKAAAAAVDSMLADLLREVEELEGHVWANNGASGINNHNTTTTTTSKDGGSVGSHLGANSLEDVRELLRERDVLWQTLVAAEAEVWRASHDWQQQHQPQARQQHGLDDEVFGIHQKQVQRSVVPSTLLRDLCALFDVSLPLSIE